MDGKVVNEGKKVSPGDMKLKHMTMYASSDEHPVKNVKQFEALSHYLWDNPAPVRQSLVQSNYFFRFRLPPKNKWMIGRLEHQRIIVCWETDYPPLISHKDEFVNEFIHEAAHAAPELAGHFGTLMGARWISSALEAVPEQVLWEWLVYKEKQRLNNKENVYA